MGYIGDDGELTEEILVRPDELEAPVPAEVPAEPVPQEVPA